MKAGGDVFNESTEILFYAERHHFLHTRDTLLNEVAAGIVQSNHAVLSCKLAENLEVLFTNDRATHIFIHVHDLMYGNSSLIAGATAELTAVRMVDIDRLIDAEKLHFLCGGLHLLLTFGAKALNESLCDNADQSIRYEVVCNAHVLKTGDRTRCVIGMEGTEYKVSRDCRTNSDFSGFFVSHLTDHDNVRVLSQDGTKRRREGHIGFRIDLRLVDTRHDILDRVFNGDNVDLGTAYFLQEWQRGKW